MPLLGTAPITVSFTFTGSDDVTAWLWSFGDGNTATTENPTNTYTVAGTYEVTLITTSPHGTAFHRDTVTVNGSSSVWTPPVPAFGLTPGWDPQVMLRISNDGGKTWGPELWRSAGKMGEYTKRVSWNRMGSARRRVFEVTMTDPIPWKITGCYLEAIGADK